MHTQWLLDGPHDDMETRVCQSFPDGSYTDEFVTCTGWTVWRDGNLVAEVIEASPGFYELWLDGDMVEVASPARALESLGAALSVQRFARNVAQTPVLFPNLRR